MARQRLQLEIEKLVDVQRPGLVMLEELLVARFVDFAIEHAFFDQKLCPLEIAVAGQQGVVQVEESEAHIWQQAKAGSMLAATALAHPSRTPRHNIGVSWATDNARGQTPTIEGELGNRSRMHFG